MSFQKQLQILASHKYTENGATALSSTGQDLVDLFGVVGALRGRNDEVVEQLFRFAMEEDALLATKLAFYARDIRGGLGERHTARVFFRVLAKEYPEIMKKNLHLLKEYGRYDDLVELMDTPLQEEVVQIIKVQLSQDMKNITLGKGISLLGKWLPSANTSSYKTRRKARQVAKALGLTEKEYRKMLVGLRAYANVTEVRVSNKDYQMIHYGKVPSYAMKKYRFSFARHDSERFQHFLDNVKKGEESIQSSTLYPYDIVETYLDKLIRREVRNAKDVVIEDEVLEAQWKALPNYVPEDQNFLIMADTSGSMYGRPMAIAVGLAIYYAQRTTGTFKDQFLSFSNHPELIRLNQGSLFHQVNQVMSTDWGLNTNLEAAFELVLEAAKESNASKEEMPTSIVVISDMEIDRCVDLEGWSFYEGMKKKFEDCGYEIPTIVFWNVDARQNTFHASSDTKGVKLVSGASPSVFKALVEGTEITPYDVMVSTLNVERYAPIEI